MSDFHQRPFNQRFAALGDQAEGKFLELNPKAHRLGLLRPELNMRKMDAALRYTPDFMLENGAYEVMGCSSRGDQTLKLKLEKLEALLAWNELMPTHLWVFDSHKKRIWEASIGYWAEACHASAEPRAFEDNGRPYWALPISLFPVDAKVLSDA